MNPRYKITAILLMGLLPFVLTSANYPPGNEEPVKLVINAQEDGKTIPADYIGLSYETKVLLPDENGHYYFRADNKALVAVFKTLGIKNLRIGGNSVDVATVPIPTEKDIDQLFAFAKAAGVKVIYSVRLHDGDPQSAARLAKHIYKNYADLLDLFAVGNEPGYYKDYEGQLKPYWESIVKAMQEVAPKARFCAPDDNPNPVLAERMVHDFGAPKGPVSLVTVHSYPAGGAYKNPQATVAVKDLIPNDAKQKRELLLSAKLTTEYESIYSKMEPLIAHFPYRLSETNSIWYGGLEGASNTYAAALWGLDYMYWWASHGAFGINFHTGDKVGGGDKSLPSRYAAFVTEGSGYEIRPLSYAIKAFDLGFTGKLAPVSLPGRAENLTAYATKAKDGTFFITLINKEYGAGAKNRMLDLSFTGAAQISGTAACLLLEAPAGDVSVKNGIALGGKGITPDGKWDGNSWKPLKAAQGMIHTEIPPASAMIIAGQCHDHKGESESLSHS
ncbi:MAG: hypothetical protein INR73_06690 [Williamsia sp.]|nr:hypothetical protein [Williamsia sp.]